MATIFISHSSRDNAEALAVRDWMVAQGWDDLFLDIDPERGIVAGERWLRALQVAGARAGAVVFLISESWLSSQYCRAEYFEATREERPLFGLILDDTAIEDIPSEFTGWQLVNMTQGSAFEDFEILPPPYEARQTVKFSKEGLKRLRAGLIKAGLTSMDTDSFAWPPASDSDRAPFRGLAALEQEDAGIFFGRDAELVRALDHLTELRAKGGRKLMVILGASGAGKSSFLRAGLVPRLERKPTDWLVLSPVRPLSAPISGPSGLVAALERASKSLGLKTTRAALKEALAKGAGGLARCLAELQASAVAARPQGAGSPPDKAPTLILPIDQAEELLGAESGKEEAARFITMLGEVLRHGPEMIVLATIRTDAYPALQNAPALRDLQESAPLPVMGRDGHRAAIEGPVRRLNNAGRKFKIAPGLVTRLLDKYTGSDALPLLAFTLEQLFLDRREDGALDEADYDAFGGEQAAIARAAAKALADTHAQSASAARPALPEIPADTATQNRLLRQAFFPWLVGLNEVNGAPLRRVARRSDIPQASWPLIDRLTFAARLLRTDLDKDGEPTVEIAHEALLRQWPLLQGWLLEEGETLRIVQGVERAAEDWQRQKRRKDNLVHAGGRLKAARRLMRRSDLRRRFTQAMQSYLKACGGRQWRNRAVGSLGAALVAGSGAAVYYQEPLGRAWKQLQITELSRNQLAALEPGENFRDCRFDAHCPDWMPDMVVLPEGLFLMGSPADDREAEPNEKPQSEVSIKRFAAGRYEVTHAQWQACVDRTDQDALEAERRESEAANAPYWIGCAVANQSGFGGGDSPVIDVSWHDAQGYVRWLNQMVSGDPDGGPYRLLSVAEWEYAARGATRVDAPVTRFSWGDDDPVCEWGAENGAMFYGCGYSGTQSVGFSAPNAFGLHDMHGNVSEWVEDCYVGSYSGAPTDGSARIVSDCSQRVLRGGSWGAAPQDLRSALRYWNHSTNRDYIIGFRVARTLSPPAP